MTTHNFSIKEVLAFGWGKTKANYWFILQVGIISSLVYGASRYLGPVSVIVAMCIGVSLTTVALMLEAGQTPKLEDLFKKYDNHKVLLNYLFVTVLLWLIIGVGFVFLFIPGIFLAVKLQFAKTLVIDQDMKALDAIKKSWSMTEGNFWNLLGYVLVVVLINFAGALLLGIGLLITVPTTMLASIHLYKKFIAHHSTHHTHSA